MLAKYSTNQRVFNKAASHILSGNSIRETYIDNRGWTCAIGVMLTKQELAKIKMKNKNGQSIGALIDWGDVTLCCNVDRILLSSLQGINDTYYIGNYEKKARLRAVAAHFNLNADILEDY